jgi:hypothetical protein
MLFFEKITNIQYTLFIKSALLKDLSNLLLALCNTVMSPQFTMHYKHLHAADAMAK